MTAPQATGREPEQATGQATTLGWHRVLDWRPGSPWARAAIVLLLVAPIAIAGTMMWAMWDPSKYLRNIELAVVNHDAGVEKRGEYTNYGDQVVEGLLKTDYLNFAEVSEQEAAEGLTRGKYMLVVTIPEVFSQQATSLTSDNPVRPEINFAANDYYGTNASFITASLVPQVQTKVENAITKKYADQILAGMGRMSDGLTAAADGAGRLDEGVAKLQEGGGRAVEGIGKLDDGATQLADGATTLAAGTSRLGGGIGELSAGAGKLRDGAHELANGTDRLAAGTGQLADGAGQINVGVAELTGKLIPLLEQAQAVAPQLAQAENTLRAAGLQAQANQVADLRAKLDPASGTNMVSQLGRLRDGTAQLHYNLSDPSAPYLSGVLALQNGAHRLAEGTDTLGAGIGRLADGATQLDAGAHKLADGAGALSRGTGQLRAGGAELAGGIGKLKEGSGELSTKLAEGANKAPHIPHPDKSAEQMAVPINFTSTNLHPVQTVVSETDPTAKQITGGVSMLAVMVFGFLLMLLVALLLPYYFGRIPPRSALSVASAWLTKTAVNAALLLALAGISAAAGWSPHKWGLVIVALLATAAAATAVYQLFHVMFGRLAGGAFALGFYALGVMVFGGVWPILAVPAFLRAFHFVHPMTYAKDAFVVATDGLAGGFGAAAFWGPVGALVAFTIIALGISVAALRVRGRAAASVQ
ncbi:YhgE/Pip family protein [Corynebacterium lizhenjunii]|uniref:YhgE/Pip family protein n=1 Tax=Corynebacterium lizhenjunii TaxID=2709394 RepID=UPI0013EBA9F7|nr:YhgE/Pip domain-containing protein [Corynebacterium lizhenjunii]